MAGPLIAGSATTRSAASSSEGVAIKPFASKLIGQWPVSSSMPRSARSPSTLLEASAPNDLERSVLRGDDDKLRLVAALC